MNFNFSDFAFEIDHDEFNIVNSSQKAVTKEPVFLNNEINNSANFKGSNTYVTVGLIALSVIIFPILIFYYNKRKGIYLA